MNELVFYLSYRSACTQDPISMDEMFKLDVILNEDYQIFCRNQWEIDLLLGMSLMYGKELKDVSTWDDWMRRLRLSKTRSHYDKQSKTLRLKDYIISTYNPGNRFRGL